MNTIGRAISCLSFVLGALVAPSSFAQAPVFAWTQSMQDSGMAQYPTLNVYFDFTGHPVLYVGSENFSSTGAGKVNTITQNGAISTYDTPAYDESVDVLGVFVTAFLGSQTSNSIEVICSDAPHVYLFDGTNWTNITPTAAAFSSNLGVYSVEELGQKLFIGTGGNAGSAQVWAYSAGQWTQQSLPGFPSSNYYAWVMKVFNGALYLGTVDYSEAAQVWKYDGSSWSMVAIPGFSSSNYAIASMAVFNGRLYIGTSNTLGAGAEIWSFDGNSWTKLPGFGRNGAVTAMAVHNGVLYIGTTNYTQGAVAQLWSYDGTTLAQVTAPGTFTSAGNTGIVSLASFNGALYAGTYNNSGAQLWSLTATGASGAPNLPGALSGLWWNPNESGWGIDFTQRGSAIFAAWYTYDASGKPKWYVASDCAGVSGTSGTCNGTLYQVNGPIFFGVPFTPATSSQISSAGSLQVTFTDANAGSMSYNVGGVSRTVSIERQPVSAGTGTPAVDHTDLWWNSSESGWGVAMAEQAANIFLAWYVYDGGGNPVWYVASNCTVSGSSCTGALYATTGPAFGTTFDPSQVHSTMVGSVTVNFSDANNAVLSYTVNGASGSKNITRQLF